MGHSITLILGYIIAAYKRAKEAKRHPAARPIRPRRCRPDAEPRKEGSKKNPAAVALGGLGNIGEKARAAKLSPAKCDEIAIKAASARWNKETSG